MSRLIDANELQSEYKKYHDGKRSVLIDVAQTIDAVEVVRCKDCKHRYIENMTWHCPFGLMGGEDFFCGYGSLGRAERRSDD